MAVPDPIAPISVPSSLNRPAFAVLRLQELLRPVVADRLRVDAVPRKAAGAIGDVAQQYGLGQRTAVRHEVARGGRAAFAGVDPLLVEAGRVGNGLVRGFEVRKLVFRIQLAFAEPAQQHAFAADEQRVVAGFGQIVLPQHVRPLVRVVPVQRDGGPFAVGRETRNGWPSPWASSADGPADPTRRPWSGT